MMKIREKQSSAGIASSVGGRTISTTNGIAHVPPQGGIASLLVDSHTAARLLSISPRKLWQLTKDGDIPHVRMGRSVRYDVADLHSSIEKMKQNGGEA